MNIQDQVQHISQATVKAAPAIAPGALTLVADYLGVINTGLSVILMVLSILFLLWRWREAWRKEDR